MRIRTGLTAICRSCGVTSFWVGDRLAHPPAPTGPVPQSDMPPGVLELDDEARSVADVSPRAAAALLRVSLEQLTVRVDRGCPDRAASRDAAVVVRR